MFKYTKNILNKFRELGCNIYRNDFSKKEHKLFLSLRGVHFPPRAYSKSQLRLREISP